MLVRETSDMAVICPPVNMVFAVSMQKIDHWIRLSILVSARSDYRCRNILLHGLAVNGYFLVPVGRCQVAKHKQPCDNDRFFHMLSFISYKINE